VPESRSRKKPVYTPPAPKQPTKRARKLSQRWVAPTMITLLLVGLLYIVVFYLAGSSVPIMKDLSSLVNVLIGFGFILAGFVVATRWR
jgi:hypothetical protein